MESPTESEEPLETERLFLEPIQRRHALHLFPGLSDHRIYAFIPEDPPASVSELEARFQSLESRQSPAGDEVWLNWAVLLKPKGEYIGITQATIQKRRSANIAYQLCFDYWHQGYAFEACRRMIEFIRTAYNVEEVVAEIDTLNEASARLLERLSFRRIAFRPGADFFKGRRSDEYVYLLVL